MLSNSSLSNKRKRKDLRQQTEQEEQEEMIEALCAKLNAKHRATNTPFESINPDVHMDLTGEMGSHGGPSTQAQEFVLPADSTVTDQ